MAKQRIINTKTWDDKYVRSLDPHGKLLFVYLFTNALATISGAYEIEKDRMRFDTGITATKIETLLAKFAEDGKAEYRDGWLLMVNTISHQATTNKKIRAGIEESVKCCPDWIKDRLSIAYDWLSHLNSNTNTNSNSNINTNTIGDADAPAPSPNSHLETILTGLRQRFKLNVLHDEPGWVNASAWAMANKFPADQVLECYDLMKQQKWRKGRITPDNLIKNLPEMENIRAEIAEERNEKKPDPGHRHHHESTADALKRIGARPRS